MEAVPQYEVVGRLTREQAVEVAEALALGSVLWDRGHTFPCDGVEIRPALSTSPAPDAVKRYVNDGDLLPDGRTYVLASDYDPLARQVAGLREALKGLYDDQVDYLTINKLGGMDNHWMVRARKELGL